MRRKAQRSIKAHHAEAPMHRRSMLMSATAMALTACAAPAPPSPAEPGNPTEPPPPLSSSDLGYDVALYRAIAAESGNHFVSPFSVSCAFALVYPGAGGATASEIAFAFAFDASPTREAINTRARADLLQAQRGGSEFTLANAAWVERSMALRPAYAANIRDTLGSTIEQVDFIRNQPAALRQINQWAARETRDRIPEILTEPDPMRRLVLTNAVYFKGKWTDPFSADATHDGQFYTNETARVAARLMRQQTRARYFDTPSFQAAEFDYDEGAFALAVFLPRSRTGLTAFENELTGERLGGYLNQLASAERPRLDVTLPKIETRGDYKLKPQLQALGIRQVFEDGADLDAIADDPTLKISEVIHKTFLAIDEEGTEAAAVTAVDIMTTAAPAGPPPPPPIEFKADRPFFIVLHHKPTRTRLFFGRIATTAP
jgi:serpin B